VALPTSASVHDTRQSHRQHYIREATAQYNATRSAHNTAWHSKTWTKHGLTINQRIDVAVRTVAIVLNRTVDSAMPLPSAASRLSSGIV
jgi:hypothetical protein